MAVLVKIPAFLELQPCRPFKPELPGLAIRKLDICPATAWVMVDADIRMKVEAYGQPVSA